MVHEEPYDAGNEDICDEETTEQIVQEPVRKSGRNTSVPTKFKDFVYDIPERRTGSQSFNAVSFVEDSLRESGYYSEEYLASLNNVLRERERTNALW